MMLSKVFEVFVFPLGNFYQIGASEARQAVGERRKGTCGQGGATRFYELCRPVHGDAGSTVQSDASRQA